MPPSSRRADIDSFIVMDVMEAARAAEAAGRHIVHMEVGQPGTPAPAGARAALVDAMATEPLGYTVALGQPALRERIARYYAERHGLTIDPARVVVTAGASGAFVLAFTALFDAGQRVALGAPGYPSYRQILKALSLMPVEIETTAEDRFQPRPDALPDDVAGLILASPANPSGTMLDRDALAALSAAARARGTALISDEIYHGLEYDRPAVTALAVDDDAIVINSFSKYFSMTGWRVGWMVVPPDLVRPVERLAQNLFICPSHAAQVVARAAFDCGPELEANREVYRANRDLLIAELPRIGLGRIAPPDGAFYVYADVGHLTDDSRRFAAEILEGAGVAVTPGLDFDPVRGHRTLRLSYAGSTAAIAEGVGRLGAFLATRG